MMSWNRVEEDEEYNRAVNHYWRQVALTDGFDVEGIKQPPHPVNYGGMICITVPEEGWWGPPFRREVTLYARFGLHRFNMKEGTKWELDNIIKFNVRTRNLASTFFITLAADRRRQILQVRVDEIKNGSGRLDLVCSIAKVKGDRDLASALILPGTGKATNSRSCDVNSESVGYAGIMLRNAAITDIRGGNATNVHGMEHGCGLGFGLHQRYKSQFMKVVNVVREHFLQKLKAKKDTSDLLLIIAEITAYLDDRMYLKEPEGRSMKTTSTLSSEYTAEINQQNDNQNYKNNYYRGYY
ncbi:unnamed protein product [Arabidopsis arenosa]|uniref:Uncharacterized protein n=1 Tax=Arabidopsis arenosa TaxID=38785 RepID=A0A8S1ZFP1_ARAAE|nr:unnamed protein product [Arabidopsis arenosa]